jgi:hypothetical protein
MLQSWRGKSAVFRIYSALTSNGYRKSIKAVRRQRNLGLYICELFSKNIYPSNELSDHCIIWFSLKTPNSLDSITKCKQDDIYTYSIPGKFCVDNGKSDYITLLENDEDQAIEYFLLQVNDPAWY